ncbi:ead/Ea22-like family protein [Enterobacter cloacae]|uniref:ead/Ea22-like family protein n=1 Tax=Enterobacter cloacae TaxID=550 RepID=UPI003F42554E
MNNIDKQALRDRYSEKPAPKCHICGSVMTIQRAGAGSVVYGCTGRIDKDGEGYKFAEGRDFADDHYARSRVTVPDESDPDVLALLDELEAKDNRINRLEAIVAVAEKRNALMREWKRALKVPCDLVDDQVPVVIHGMVIRLERLKETEEKLEAAEKRIAELESDNAYIKKRHKELDLLIGKNILVMQAAIIEWQGTGDAKKGLAWIYNTLFGPGELPDESEKDAQAYFDRKYAPLDEELMNLHRWFWEQSEAERAAAAGKGE